MNQKLNKEIPARTTDDSSTKDDEQHVSPAIGNTNVIGSLPVKTCGTCGSRNVKEQMQKGYYYCDDCQCEVC